MPFRTEFGTHYHMMEGCHGATIPCGTEGLTPCSDCCGGGGDKLGTGAGGTASGGSPDDGYDDVSSDSRGESSPERAEGGGHGITAGTYESGMSGLAHGLSSPDLGQDGIVPSDLRHTAGSVELAHADSGMYTSRAVPEIVLTENEARLVARTLAMYIDSGAYAIGRDDDGYASAYENDFKKVLQGMMSDLVPVMPKEEHEERARREITAFAEDEVRANCRPVDRLEPCDPYYMPFSSYPVELRGNRLEHGIPDATGWSGVPFVDARRNGKGQYMGRNCPVWDYLPEPFETHEDVPISLEFGNYRLEAVINCGISPVPGSVIRDDYDYGKSVEAPAPSVPRVERVRLTAAIRNGVPIELDDDLLQEDGDFDKFRHGIEDWLAEQERQGRPAFGNSPVDRGGRAFMRYCIERDRKKQEQEERDRQWQEKRERERQERSEDRRERMSRY